MFLCTTGKCDFKLNQFEKWTCFVWIIDLNCLMKHFSASRLFIQCQTCLNSWSSRVCSVQKSTFRSKRTQTWEYESTQKGMRPEIRYFFFNSILLFFTTLPLECSCVCQSDPPGHKASTSRPVAFQPEASFSFTAGGKQTNTRENSNETVETLWTKEKKQNIHTSSLCVGSRKALTTWPVRLLLLQK